MYCYLSLHLYWVYSNLSSFVTWLQCFVIELKCIVISYITPIDRHVFCIAFCLISNKAKARKIKRAHKITRQEHIKQKEQESVRCWNNTLQHTATHCNTLQHTATHCNALQHTATQTQQLKAQDNVRCWKGVDVSTHYNTLQHAATHCNTDPATKRAGNVPTYRSSFNTFSKTQIFCNTQWSILSMAESEHFSFLFGFRGLFSAFPAAGWTLGFFAEI